MVRTLSTLDQLALANAGVMSTHYCPEMLPIAEDTVIELLHPDLQPPFLQILGAVEKLDDQDKGNACVAFARTTVLIAAESKDREEFMFIRSINVRTFRLWKSLGSVEGNDEMVEEDAFYRKVAASIANRVVRDWTEKHDTAVLAMDITQLASTVYSALRDGSYWSDGLYDRDVEMSPTGVVQFVGKQGEFIGNDEWPELFENQQVH